MLLTPDFHSIQSKKQVQALWATRSQFFVLGLVSGTWGAHIPTVKAVYHLSESLLSWVLFALACGAVSALLIAGRTVSRWGAQRSVQVCAIALILLFPALLHWPSFAWLLAAMVVLGASLSLFDVAINTEGSALEHTRQQPIMGNLHGFFSLGGMFGAFGSGWMLREQWPAAQQLSLVGGLGAIIILLGSLLFLKIHASDDRGHEASHALQRPRGVLLILGLLAFAGMSSEGIMYDWSVLYMQQDLGMMQAQAVWGYAIFSAAMASARFGGDALRARFNERWLLHIGGIVTALAITLMLLSKQTFIALICHAFMGIGLAMIVPIIFNAAGRVPGHSRASAIATVSAIGYSGFLLGPPVIGYLAQLFSLSWALAVIIPLATWLAWGAHRLPTIPSRTPVFTHQPS